MSKGKYLLELIDLAFSEYEADYGHLPRSTECPDHFCYSPLRQLASLADNPAKAAIVERITRQMFRDNGFTLSDTRVAGTGDFTIVGSKHIPIRFTDPIHVEVKSGRSQPNNNVIIDHVDSTHDFQLLVMWIMEPNRVRIYSVPRDVAIENITREHHGPDDRWLHFKTSNVPEWMNSYLQSDFVIL